jgi:amino acid transporter
VLLDYLFLPMVIWLIGASYLTAAVPGVPSWVWIVGFMVITTVLNIVGIKVADRVNFVLMAFQFLVIALIGGGIFIVVTYFTQLVHPGGSFADESSAAFEIAQTIGGNVFSAVFVAGLIIAQFTSGLAAQASGSRLLYAMGRDGVLPRRIFAIVHRGFHTPWGAIVVVGVVGLIALFLDVATSTSFVNFGAFIAFAMVNISVIVLAVRSRRDGAPANVLLDYVFPAVGALVIIGLLTQLDSNALIIGGVWVAVGLVILATLTGGFRRQPPSVDPDAFAG